MMSVKIFILVLAICVTRNYALFCYSCAKLSVQEKCQSGKYLPREDCPDLSDAEKFMGLRPICYKIIYNFSNGSKTHDRGCSSNVFNSSDLCTGLLRDSEMHECFTCSRDLCNGSRLKKLEIWMLIITAFIVIEKF